MPEHDDETPENPENVPIVDQDEGPLFLTFREIDKIYEQGDEDQVFLDISEEFPPQNAKASIFGEVASAIGTHSLKFITTKAAQGKAGQSVFVAGEEELMFSGNAAFSKYAKVLLRPIRFSHENVSRSVMERLFMSGGERDSVSDAFANVFGEEALETIREVAFPQSDAVTELPSRNCPVIFLPHPDGDVQATPISPMIAFNRIKGETSRFFRKREKGETGHVPRGDFVFSSDTSKMQLLSPQVSGLRRRFRATAPEVCQDAFAGVYRFVKTRRMPPIWDDDVGAALLRFVELNAADMAGASSRAVSEALDHLITFLTRRALTHAVDMCEAAREMDPSFDPPSSLDVRDLLIPCGKHHFLREFGKGEEAAKRLADLRAGLNGRGSRVGFDFTKGYAEMRTELFAANNKGEPT